MWVLVVWSDQGQGKRRIVFCKNSTNHCTRTSFWWVCTWSPHLWSVHLLNWHFSFTYQFPSVSIPISKPLNFRPIFVLDNLQLFQCHINIFYNPCWRRCSHFRFPYTLDPFRYFLWYRDTEPHNPLLLVVSLPIKKKGSRRNENVRSARFLYWGYYLNSWIQGYNLQGVQHEVSNFNPFMRNNQQWK